MKKLIVTFGLVIIFVFAYIFYNKLYYPSLPIENMSKREVLQEIRQSNEELVKLSKENGHEWYVITKGNQGIATDIIKEMVTQYGWTYNEQMGSGHFFEKNEERLIVTTQMWTSHYVLVQIPTNFNE